MWAVTRKKGTDENTRNWKTTSKILNTQGEELSVTGQIVPDIQSNLPV